MTVLSLIIFIITAAYLLLNFKFDIQMLQQNSYRISRYRRWLSKNCMSSWRLVDLALLFLLFSTLVTAPVASVTAAATLLCKSVVIARRKYKKPLVFTRRVWRIYSVTAVIGLGLFGVSVLMFYGVIRPCGVRVEGFRLPMGVALVEAMISYCVVVLAVLLLSPVERLINRRYYRDAQRILNGIPGLKVIGITGSFGKTSTKHYLEAILSEDYEVLMTPGSYNTTMGVIRTVREMLKPYHSVFICEMGAKQAGDIKEICDLVHPSVGIVTAVGPMHLETFGSLDNVQRTKFELVDALPVDGLAVVNNDFELCAGRHVDNVRAVRYAVKNPEGASYVATDIEYSPAGTAFNVIEPDGTVYPYTTPLVGECNISNLLAAIATARNMDMQPEKIKMAVARLSQVEHRLSIRRTPGGATIIDDAFNSNPYGSRMALEVLHGFTGGKRIIITPGMIELGERQEELNREFGEAIAGSADIAIIVGHYNRDSILSGVKAGGMTEENIYTVSSFNEAQKILGELLTAGDTVLYENDLPDTFK